MSELNATLRGIEEPSRGFGCARDISGRNKITRYAVLNYDPVVSYIGNNYRNSARHRLKNDIWSAFVSRQQGGYVAGVIDRRDIFVVADKTAAIRQAQALRHSFDLGFVLAPGFRPVLQRPADNHKQGICRRL